MDLNGIKTTITWLLLVFLQGTAIADLEITSITADATTLTLLFEDPDGVSSTYVLQGTEGATPFSWDDVAGATITPLSGTSYRVSASIWVILTNGAMKLTLVLSAMM